MREACGKCNQSEPESEIPCRVCQRWFHRSCVTDRMTRGNKDVICDTCASSSLNTTPPNQRFLEPLGQSTAMNVGTSHTDSVLDRMCQLAEIVKQQTEKFEEMMNIVRAFKHVEDVRHTGAAAHIAQPRMQSDNRTRNETVNVVNNGTSVNNSSSSSRSIDASLWRTRLPADFVQKALNTTPLTKDQLTRRKQGTELPRFNGQTSGEMCGFTITEDMRRIQAALSGPALTLVEPYMANPENLDAVINALQQNFGQRYMLLEAVSQRIKKLPSLQEDLANIGKFAGEVDLIRIVSNMDPEQPVGSHCVTEIESKLPDRHADKWLDIRGIHALPEINALADFLMDLHARQIALRRPTVAKGAKVKTVLVVQEQVHMKNTLSGASQPQKAYPKQCVFKCLAEHLWTVCPKFKEMNVKTRWRQVRNHRRCAACLDRHPKGQCRTDAVCNVQDFQRRHHPLLHPVGIRVEESLNYTQEENKSTFFKVVPVDLVVGEHSRRVYCLMDSGSCVTLIDQQLATDMGLHGNKMNMALSWADGNIRSISTVQRVTFRLKNAVSGQQFEVKGNTYQDLKLPKNRVTHDLLTAEGLDHLPIDRSAGVPPLVLIGQDNGALMRSMASWEGESKQIFASETPLGYAIEGELRPKLETVLVTDFAMDQRMDEMLMRHINEERFGLKPDDTVVVESVENQKAKKIMETTTHQRADTHYETGLLWREDSIKLPDNSAAVRNRHTKWERALWKDPVRHQKVTELIRNYLKKGYIRPAESATIPERVWYLPIFTVYNKMKPDKTRVVWDCAAQFKGVSLNSALVSGPDLTQPLINVLLRFRTGQFAITGDIEEMFHQIFVREEDRCSQRFFWRNNDKEQLTEYEMCVLTFGATCSPTLAQFAKNLNAQRFKKERPMAVKGILENHYVDDYLDSGHEEEELLDRVINVSQIHQKGGFNMHKFGSNSPRILRGLGAPEIPDKEVSLSVSSCLGLSWNTHNDLLSFRFSRERFRAELMDGSDAPTKREMLKVVMSIFDPMGLVSFFTMEGKIIFREAGRTESKWDDKLHGGIQRRWALWTKHLSTLEEITIPRWHGTVHAPVYLHIFVDASETAICSTCYVLQDTAQGRVRSLCLAKCLLAPLQTKSIPRLELEAAVLGIRLHNMVRAAHPWNIRRVHYWTDAKDVLHWIRNPFRRYSPYVSNRVAEVLRYSTIEQWRWVPTDQNPADWGTKWINSRGREYLWWHGPDYLDKDPIFWPDCRLEAQELLEERPLLTVSHQNIRFCLVPAAERFEQWPVFVKSCAMALKFIEILRRRAYPGPLHEEELRRAEAEIFRDAQGELLQLPKFKRFLSPLAPFYDDKGVLRMRGRTARAEILPYDARFPVILKDDHPAVTLLIKYYHHCNNHQNTTGVINELRQRIIIPNMRATVKKIIGHCQRCVLRRAHPVLPQMGALPLDRLAIFQPPFSYVGLDYFGPLDVAIGRRREKRWVALFTCLTTRAIYLEVVSSLSGSSSTMALDSLTTRRGLPLQIQSDNATCFVNAAKEYRGPNGAKVLWRFIPPNSPSMGGAWERLVGAVKVALNNMALPRTPTEENLRRALLQAERLVNSRPLTEIPVDPEEEESLTPNHFLLGSSNGLKPRADVDTWDSKRALADWEKIVASFWERFVKEYLPTISARSKWHKKVDPLRVGDLVFICDQDHRFGWRRGRVVRVAMDNESGQVRDVSVTTADGKTYRRGACSVALILRPDGPQEPNKTETVVVEEAYEKD